MTALGSKSLAIPTKCGLGPLSLGRMRTHTDGFTVLPMCSPERALQMKLTKATVAGLTLPAGRDEKIYWDDDIPLFGVRLRKGGSKGWVFWYRLGGRASPLRKIGLGATSAVSAAEARAEAARLYAKVRLGQDPAGEKAESIVRASETFEIRASDLSSRGKLSD